MVPLYALARRRLSVGSRRYADHNWGAAALREMKTIKDHAVSVPVYVHCLSLGSVRRPCTLRWVPTQNASSDTSFGCPIHGFWDLVPGSWVLGVDTEDIRRGLVCPPSTTEHWHTYETYLRCNTMPYDAMHENNYSSKLKKCKNQTVSLSSQSIASLQLVFCAYFYR
jgi:hypothetical protein